MTEYNLGQLDTVAGVLTFTLRHGDPSLEVPSRIRIISSEKFWNVSILPSASTKSKISKRRFRKSTQPIARDSGIR